MQHKKRWYRKWNLDKIREDVIAVIDQYRTPEKYDHSAFDGPFAPKDSDALTGKTLKFNGEGKHIEFKFTGINNLTLTEGENAPVDCFGHIRTMEDQVYYVHFLVPGYETARMIVLIADMVTGCATIVDGHIGTPNSNIDVEREFIFGTLEGIYKDAPLHEFTSEMVGHAIIWEYGDQFPEVKHIYNSNYWYTYAMDVPSGTWMATNPANYVKIREKMYVFSFFEERQPGLQMCLLMDWNTMHDIGCVFGLSADGSQFHCGCVGGHGKFADVNTVF